VNKQFAAERIFLRASLELFDNPLGSMKCGRFAEAINSTLSSQSTVKIAWMTCLIVFTISITHVISALKQEGLIFDLALRSEAKNGFRPKCCRPCQTKGKKKLIGKSSST